MREKIFCDECVRYLKSTNCFYLKIPDSIRTEATRFLPKKPFDLIVSYSRIKHAEDKISHEAIELKQSKQLRLEKSKITREQIENLCKIEKFDYKSFFIVNFRINRKVNETFKVHFSDIENRIQKRKPLTLSWFRKNFRKIEKLRIEKKIAWKII